MESISNFVETLSIWSCLSFYHEVLPSVSQYYGCTTYGVNGDNIMFLFGTLVTVPIWVKFFHWKCVLQSVEGR